MAAFLVSLDGYLDEAARRAWRWGGHGGDCCFFAGDWILAATGRDPLGPYRQTYDSARGARRLIERRGGLLAMVSAEMTACGFSVTTSFEDGDVAIVALETEGEAGVAQAAGVIRRGPWWHGKTARGIAGFDVPVLRAWRVL